jgi:membrane protease YdiL (CAAX protease family)
MISEFITSAAAFSASADALASPPAAPHPAETAAWWLLAAGLTVVFTAAIRHIRRRGLKPFHGAAVRGNRLTPLLAVIPAMAYVLGFLLLDPIESAFADGATAAGQHLRNSCAQLIGAICCLWVGGSAFRRGLRGFLVGPDSPWSTIPAALGYFLAATALCELTYWATVSVTRALQPEYDFFDHQVIQTLRDGEAPWWAPAALWAGAAIVAPLAEEGFFRGLIQTLALRFTRRRGLAIAGTAVFFAVAHADQPHVLPAMIVFGLVIGLQYERSGGLFGPMLAHALFNLKTLIWEWWTRTPA